MLNLWLFISEETSKFYFFSNIDAPVGIDIVLCIKIPIFVFNRWLNLLCNICFSLCVSSENDELVFSMIRRTDLRGISHRKSWKRESRWREERIFRGLVIGNRRNENLDDRKAGHIGKMSSENKEIQISMLVTPICFEILIGLRRNHNFDDYITGAINEKRLSE